jgi:DNA-binding NarL/FixJ family response regulator
MQGAGVIRCVVADDHEALRAGLVKCLNAQEGIEVVGEAADGDEALGLIERRRPDIAVLDLNMPGLDGLEACRRLSESGAGVAVLLYTGSGDAATLRAGLDAGARGYLLKAGPLSDLVRAVRIMARGETYVEATLVTALLEHDSHAGRSPLSQRETEVLQHLADGLTTDAVARELFLSAATVRSYAETAMQKLDSRNRTHAVAAAIRDGLIS